jgi:LPS-assembly protein
MAVIKRLWLIIGVLWALPVRAQPPAQPPAPPVSDNVKAITQEAANDQKDWYYREHVEFSRGDVSIYADEAWLYQDYDLFLALGNVVFRQGKNQISANYAEFNTKTNLGTFYNASGIATIQPPKQTPQPGSIAIPQMTGQENVVFFFGEQIEKIGPRKYHITNGAMTTCFQPTPRWDLSASTITLHVDDYTFMKNAVLTAKGVPLLYLPIMYYPTKHGDRATGFLIPTLGFSSLRGTSLHNAFFWAINRSQDATFFHDYFSKTGQGYGSEYRYNYGRGTDGDIRAYFLDQHEATYTDSVGGVNTVPANNSFELRGGANQALPFNMRARFNANYFSSIQTSQTFNTNIYDASRNSRSLGANVTGTFGSYSMNATADRNETFYPASDSENPNLRGSTLYGNGPRINISRNEKPLFGSDVYFSVGGEFANIIRDSRTLDGDIVTDETDLSLSRFDVRPQIRYPFKKWAWLTANSTVSWRDTEYSKSAFIDPDTGVQRTDKLSDAGVSRRYYTLMTNIVGPVFTRVWDTPDNGYAEKFKHSIEPYLTIQYTSSIDNFNLIPVSDGVDYAVPGTTYTYGLNNRFYAKRKLVPGQPGQSREIFDVELSQSYYNNPLASQFDPRYSNSVNGQAAPTNFSPIALSVRGVPTSDISATMRAEFDARYHALRTISANGTYSWTGRVQTTVGWTKYGYIPELTGTVFADPNNLYQTLNATTNVHTINNHVGTIYNFSYDLLHSTLVQQQISAFYNAQCCGLAFQYQAYNYGNGSGVAVAADHRFFLTFTLAGLGNFSPFNGALGGVPR